MPQITVITPCYNSARYVGKTIESARSQTFGGWEHVVVDDGSTDDSARIVEAYCRSDPRLRLIRQANAGVSAARNAGFAAASPDSRYLLFLDADDCLLPEMLSTMTKYLDAHPAVGLAYCDPIFIDQDDRVLNVTREEMGWSPRHIPTRFGVGVLPDDCRDTPFVSMFAFTSVVPSTSVLRRSVYEQTPGFDPTFGHLYEDTDVFLHMALRAEVHKLSEPLVQYRRHAGQSTGSIERIGRQERKLREKWKNPPGLTPEQRKRVDDARWWVERRLNPRQGVQVAVERFKKGRLVEGAVFLGGAVRRYLGWERRRDGSPG